MPSALDFIRFGNWRTSPDTGYTSIAAGTLRQSHQGMAVDNIWVTRLGGWLGKATGNSADFYLGLYQVGPYPANDQPTTLLGRTALMNAATAYFSAGSGGDSLVGDIDTAYLVGGYRYPMLTTGSVYAIGPLAIGHDLAASLRDPVAVPGNAGNWKLWNKSGLSGLPDPFSPSSVSSTQGRLTCWTEGYINTAPLAPTSIGPSGTVTTLTPTFTGSFRDYCGTYGPANNGLDLGDRMLRFQIQVRVQGGDGTLLWDSTASATPTEQDNDAYSRTYGGTTLVRGTTYEIRSRVQDLFSAWGPYTGWSTFTVANAGEVTLYGTPTGKQEAINGYTFQAKWFHNSALAMTHARIRLLDSNGTTVLQQSGDITKAVSSSASPGTAFTISWAESGFVDLDWAHTYYFAISGKDSGAEWSNYYVSPFTFFTDAPPTIPADLSPTGGTVFTTPPLLSFTMTDPDDTIATGLIGRLVLTTPSRPNSGFQYSTTYNVATQRWEYQSTASSFTFNETQRVTIASASAPTGGTYTLTFGPNTTAGIAYNALPAAITSALEALANIGAGNVTVSAVTTRDFYVTFRGALAGVDQAMMSCNAGGLTGGSGHVATVLEDTKGGPAYDTWNWQGYGWDGTLYSGTGVSDTVFSNTASFVWHLGPQVTFTAPLNGDTITGSSITVTWTTTDQQKKRVQLYEAGTTTLVFDSGLITDTLSGYSIPPGMTATGSEYDLVVSVEDSLAVPGSNQITIAVVFAPADTLLNVQVAPITVSSDPVPTAIQVSWDQTTYPATDLGSGAFAWYQVARLVAGDPTWTILYKATSPDDTVFVDYVPPSGLICTYRVTQYISISGTLVSSLPVDADASIDLGQHTILTSVTSPSTWRAVLTHISGKTRTRDRSEIAYRSPNGGQSITITGLDRDQLYSIEANVITDEQASAQDRKITFTDLDAQGVTVCLRDGKTGDATKLFGRILDPVFIDQMGGTTGTWYTLAFGFRSESFQEGQS